MSRELTQDIKNKIYKEAIKRLQGNSGVKPPSAAIEEYTLMLESMWVEGIITFEWEIQ
jgi:hypothetical protein